MIRRLWAYLTGRSLSRYTLDLSPYRADRSERDGGRR